MSAQPKRSIRAQLTRLSLIIVAVSVALSLAGTLYVTLREEQRALDKNLINSASILSQSPLVREALEGTAQSEELAAYLDAATANTSDIDLILVGDTGNILFYAPDADLVGSRYTGDAQTQALSGAGPYTSNETGPLGSDHSAYAPVRGADGAVIGFVVVGIYMRSMTHVTVTTILRALLVGLLAAAVGCLLALRLSRRIKDALCPPLPPAGGHSGCPGGGNPGHRPGADDHVSQHRRRPDALPGAVRRGRPAPPRRVPRLHPGPGAAHGEGGVQRQHEIPAQCAGAVGPAAHL